MTINIIGLIDEQYEIPQSPGKMVEGEMQYCLAAAMVATKLKNTNLSDLNKLNNAILEGEGKSSILKYYNQFGWGEELGKYHMQLNDSISPDKRKTMLKIFLLQDDEDLVKLCQ